MGIRDEVKWEGDYNDVKISELREVVRLAFRQW